MFACAVESYSVRSPTHYAKTNQFPPPPFYNYLNQTCGILDGI